MITLVVDTNIIISALIKDSVARAILVHPAFTFLLPDYSIREIKRYVQFLEKKTGLNKEELLGLLDGLLENVVVFGFEDYRGNYGRAEDIMKGIDLDDAPFIALALSKPNQGIWTNDKHLHKQTKVKTWTTQELYEKIR
ncbi:MAG: PIN domain-containing protein [Candidatus Altiarchaeota archaeon]